MKKKMAMKWVRALRSGKFKQARDTLVDVERNEDGKVEKVLGHCCLGVLGEINGLNKKGQLIGEEMLMGHNRCGLAYNDGTAYDEHGEHFSIELPVKNSVTGKRVVKKVGSLADANDGGASFKAIANWIEKNFKYL